MGQRHRQLLLSAVVTASWLALSGGGSYAVTAQQETCTPAGNTLSITAFDSKFDKSCLAAPADQAFTIEFSNLDRGIPHNVAIYEDDSTTKTYFKGELLDGPGKTTYSVQGLPAGKFYFQCDPHADSMHGTFISG
jgi:plastocyanin